MKNINNSKSYSYYSNFKEWKNFYQCSYVESIFYSKILNKIPLNNVNFLDIGYGYGYLLKWASLNGAKIFGVEIQQDLLLLAREKNIKVFSDLFKIKNLNFEIITLIDVLEHLDFDQIYKYLNFTFKVLSNGGVLIIKVPNCQSPAGLANQFGDPTHKTMLSGPILAKILSDIGFANISYKKSPILDSKIFIFRFFRKLFTPLGFLFETVFRLKYSNFSGPLSPDILVYAKK